MLRFLTPLLALSVASAHQATTPISDFQTLRVLDLDGDGRFDRLGARSDGTLVVARNLGRRHFEEIAQDLPAVRPEAVLATDLNGDDALDLYLVTEGPNVALVGDGHGGFHDATLELGLADGGLGRDAEELDLDGDGRLDIVLHNADRDVLFWGTGAGYERDAASPVNPVLARFTERGVVDLNGMNSEAIRTRRNGYSNGHASRHGGGPGGGVHSLGGGSPVPSVQEVSAIGSPPCASSLIDQALGSCGLMGSSVPTMGMLVPLSNDWFIDAGTRFVGIGNSNPAASLDVSGPIRSRSGGIEFPDGTMQTSAAVDDGVPKGYQIAGDTAAAPSGYRYSGVRFDVVVDDWLELEPLPASRIDGASATIGGLMYVVGGAVDGSILADLDRYELATDTWTSLSPMPTAREFLSVAVLNGQLYAIGGRDSTGTVVSTVERYDPGSDTWTTVAPLPQPVRQCAAASQSGSIWVSGGRLSAVQTLRFLWSYDPVANVWSVETSMPVARYAHGMVAYGGFLWVVGGIEPGGPVSTVRRYDTSSSAWGSGTSMPAARFASGVVVSGGRLWVVGGADGAAVPQINIWSFDQSSWTSVAPSLLLDEGVSRGFCSTVNGVIHLAGGVTPSSSFTDEHRRLVETVRKYFHTKN